jgi:uncharacterized protein YdeI (YjbR/CyaY-like superfamily)
MPHGDGRHFLVVNAEIRKAIQKEAGAAVQITLDADSTPRSVNLPPAFETALNANKPARKAFSLLSYSHQKEYVDWIAGAKKPATQARRCEKAIDLLMAGRNPKGA